MVHLSGGAGNVKGSAGGVGHVFIKIHSKTVETAIENMVKIELIF